MDISKLQKRLQKLQEGSGGGRNIFFKSEEDKKKVRLVPYPHDPDGYPFIEAYFHYNVAGERSLVCPKETHGEPCPICELAEEFRTMGGKENWRIFKSLSPKLRTYSPVIVRGDEEAGVKLWGYGVTIYTDLIEKFMDDEWGNLSDPKTGRDLTVWSIPKGGPGNDSDFVKPKMDVSPNQSPLLAKKGDIVKLLEEMPNFLHDGQTFPVKSYQELQAIVAKLSSDDTVTDDDDTNIGSSYTSSVSDDDDDTTSSSDLNAKLSALLGD